MPASILVIDDDERLRKVMTIGLTRQGYVVNAAEDGRAGLRVFDVELPDVVITDILMPGMEGIETILALKARARPPKIIAISGGGRVVGRDFLKWAAHLGADEVLPKPFRMSALVAVVHSLLADAGDGPPIFAWRPVRRAAGDRASEAPHLSDYGAQ